MKLLFLLALFSVLIAEGCREGGVGMQKEGQHKYSNHLVDANSPYLLQHAHNPVDWYQWGEEAFALARAEDKPIFLSIGYSACHWCHVMEHESFENEEIAAILNEHFVSIKVDREQRPDVDEIYMTAVQMMTGSGGWPLSVFLTPDLKPFFGGTYFPPDDRYGRPGFGSLLRRIIDAWTTQRDNLNSTSEQLTAEISSAGSAEAEGSSASELTREVVVNAALDFLKIFDAQWGGFGNAPKFPQTGLISIILREYVRTEREDLLTAATVSLDKMAYGGIYDQLGGGFHRYSVDRRWLVPHFEKMLYDNALLSSLYLEAFQVTGKELYRRVAEETLDYVIRDMSDEAGGFHSAEDADSEGHEGKFYVWDKDEIEEAIGAEDAKLFNAYYDVSAKGNFEEKNILNVPMSIDEFIVKEGVSSEKLVGILASARRKLLDVRSRRVWPGRDDKVLAAWNGLMISSLARGYQVLGDEGYLQAAIRSGEFVREKMIINGVLYRSFRNGKTSHDGYLDDYAAVANAFIDLYETTFDYSWLQAADKLAGRMVHLFGDDNGGFYFTSQSHKNLIVRTKPFYDGSVPSGNSMAAFSLLRLARMQDRSEYLESAESILEAAAGKMSSQSSGTAYMLKALDFYAGRTREYVIVGERGEGSTGEIISLIHRAHEPNRVLVYGDGSGGDEQFPLLKGRGLVAGLPALYICENYSCKKPMTDVAEIANMLGFGDD